MGEHSIIFAVTQELKAWQGKPEDVRKEARKLSISSVSSSWFISLEIFLSVTRNFVFYIALLLLVRRETCSGDSKAGRKGMGRRYEAEGPERGSGMGMGMGCVVRRDVVFFRLAGFVMVLFEPQRREGVRFPWRVSS